MHSKIVTWPCILKWSFIVQVLHFPVPPFSGPPFSGPADATYRLLVLHFPVLQIPPSEIWSYIFWSSIFWSCIFSAPTLTTRLSRHLKSTCTLSHYCDARFCNFQSAFKATLALPLYRPTTHQTWNWVTGSPGHMVLGSLGRWVTKCDPVPCLLLTCRIL